MVAAGGKEGERTEHVKEHITMAEGWIEGGERMFDEALSDCYFGSQGGGVVDCNSECSGLTEEIFECGDGFLQEENNEEKIC